VRVRRAACSAAGPLASGARRGSELTGHGGSGRDVDGRTGGPDPGNINIARALVRALR
jgi:hypothetical protein